MNKSLFLCLSLAAALAYPAFAVEGRAGVSVNAGGTAAPHGGARYGSNGGTWAEGTISSRGADGRLTIRGTQSPYANDYFSYHHDYYSNPDQRNQLGERYRDKFRYNWNDTNLNDYSFTVPDYNDAVIYDEPNYGSDYSTWNYNNEPKTYRYGDLREGDRVVIGYDSNGNRVNSMYRVNPNNRSAGAGTRNENTATDNTRPNSNAGGTNQNHTDNTRPNNTGTSNNTVPNSNSSTPNSSAGQTNPGHTK